MLGRRCNYDCMYCPRELHDDVSRPHDLETMQQVWKNIYAQAQNKSLPFKISFTGGEVTANRNFLPLVKWLRDTYADIKQVIITTNGSASKNYYHRLAEQVESISFSTHSEFMDEKEFFDKAKFLNEIMIRPVKSFHVNVMDEHWNRDRIDMYKEWLSHHGISHSVNNIDYSKKIRELPMQKGKLNLGT